MPNVEVTIRGHDKASAALTGVTGKLQNMSGQFRKVGIAAMAMGVAIAGGLIKMTMEYAKAGDEIAKMAKRTGIATETLSKWKYMADLSGTSLDSMEKGSKKLAMAISDAKDGLETYTREFEKIGINVQELEGLSPEEQFMKIATAVAGIEDPMARAASAQRLFGKSGTDLLPMLSEGEAGLRQLSQAASENATIFDQEAALAAEKFNDSITDLKTSLFKMGSTIAEEVMPDLQKFIEGATASVKKIGEWIEANPILVGALKVFVAILVGGGGLLIALSMISKAIIAINIALAIMHSLMGPAGWAKLAAGLAIAGGTIAAISAMTGEEAAATEPALLTKEQLDRINEIRAKPRDARTAEEQDILDAFIDTGKIPTADTGGVFRGPGAVRIGNISEMMIPMGKGAAVSSPTFNITINTDVMEGNEQSARRWARTMIDYMREDLRRVGATL